MKTIIYACFAMLVLSSCQQKIGFIDNGKVINDFQQKIDLEEKFKVKEENFKKRADSIGQAFQLEAQKFQNEAKRMSQTKAQAKYQELGQKQQLLQQQMQAEQQKLTSEFQTEIDTLIIKVKDFVKDYAKTNGYNFILGTSETSATVLFGEDKSDLTKEITEALNSAYKKE